LAIHAIATVKLSDDWPVGGVVGTA